MGFSALGLPYALVLAIQGLTLLHIVKTGRDWRWIWLVLLFPLIGSAIYVWVEVRVRSLADYNPLVLLSGLHAVKIRQLREKLDDCDTLDLRIELAELLAKSGANDEAQALIKDHLDGPFKTHPYLLYTYAGICTQAGRYGESDGVLARLDAAGANDKRRQRILLSARNRAAQGDHATAEELFRSVHKSFDGEEARYWYLRFLIDRQRFAEAKQVGDEAVRYYRRSESLYRKLERPWYRGIVAALAELAKPANAAATP